MERNAHEAKFSKENEFLSGKLSIEDHGAWRAYYRLTGVRQQFEAYIEDVVRSEIPTRTLDAVYEAKNDIASAVKKELQQEMDQYGYTIVNALVTDISPDKKVQEAMNEINAAKRLRMAASEKAEAKKIMAVKAAEADSESKYLSGMGVSRQRKAIINGLKDSVNEFQDGVSGTSAADVMQLVMMTQAMCLFPSFKADIKSNPPAHTHSLFPHCSTSILLATLQDMAIAHSLCPELQGG